ncbi:exodeoxyribonuclease VII large subunit [Pelagicoccus sp. SDUM812003]|uniref:exodeoxyribonuclease VII large subunit n=1 Tax=Pelagicoccus sp. SDUM812003 TaxID=3041267 RepID=UPI00280D59CE|nr:exodeoxyribonuclease VII large subunit [Pelagicoccus sp. SDUM812003]MDQ8203376.1 exodeoxyribonuclease VII large subunit [Pelagicoccus sp. SDUM812003]
MAWDDLFEQYPEVTVSQYTASIKTLLERGVSPSWVLGEVSNLRRQSSGHLYFSLKDAGAQLPAVMFRAQASGLAFRLEDGMQVQAFGQISVYAPHGRYQLVVRELKESGQGRLFREFERLKAKLAAEGLFEKGRKRALPLLPLKVALVTSPTGAAVRDFTRILKRRGWAGRLQIFPCKVQGAGAAEEIAAAIELINEIGDYDVLVLARGGGSIEDLWSFNEEIVARAVSRSAIPTISGVGHEIDFTLSDFAADARAETPSGAAELISSAFLETLSRFEDLRDDMEAAIESRIEVSRRELSTLKTRLRALSPLGKVENALLRLDELHSRLDARFFSGLHSCREKLNTFGGRMGDLDIGSRLNQLRNRLAQAGRRMDEQARELARSRRRSLDLAGTTLRALSPEATLGRGYVILKSSSGAMVTSVADVKKGDRLGASLKDGRIELSVDDVAAE